MATIEEALRIFETHGVLRTSQASSLGIAPATLYRMRDRGVLTMEARGIYRLADRPALGNPDLVTVAIRYPHAVIALITALSFYDLTDEVPDYVYIALPHDAKRPGVQYPPLEVVWLSPEAYQAGQQTVTIDGVPVKMYDAEKTICDCFKFRNKYGEDVALTALRNYLSLPTSQRNLPKLREYARINRVEGLISAYLKALL